ncbi:MAG: CoA pyrophosphatase, partial [Deltaproteobacteria bacterium]
MISELKRRLEGRRRRVLARPRAASVLVPLVEDGGEFGLVLTRRSEDLPTHKGQVAFPGGHVDPADAGPVAAALREAQEEIGLPPDRVEVLGLLDDFPTRHDDTAVTPVVGWIPELPPLRPEPGEVARIFRIPLAALARPEAWRSQMVRHGGRSYPLYFFEWDGELLWGLSAYITLALLAETPLGPPFPLP